MITSRLLSSSYNGLCLFIGWQDLIVTITSSLTTYSYTLKALESNFLRRGMRLINIRIVLWSLLKEWCEITGFIWRQEFTDECRENEQDSSAASSFPVDAEEEQGRKLDAVSLSSCIEYAQLLSPTTLHLHSVLLTCGYAAPHPLPCFDHLIKLYPYQELAHKLSGEQPQSCSRSERPCSEGDWVVRI
jgi:hypothetical protein